MPAGTPNASRHRALADRARVAILEQLAESPEPLDAHVLAERVGSHVNTVRWHLGILIDAGLVLADKAVSGARGRPRSVYRVAQPALDPELVRLDILSRALIDALDGLATDVADALVKAGRSRGRALAGQGRAAGEPAAPEEGLAEVQRLLDLLGFAPQVVKRGAGTQIRMRPCPFSDAAALHSSIICPVHLGLMQGTLEALNSPLEATALEPFAKPDLCIAHFRSRSVPAP